MVPTMRPSPKTSIFAPTRCGVEPVVDTMVTSAASSPRSSASATAANTSWFILERLYGGRSPEAFALQRSAVQIAGGGRLGPDEEGFVERLRAERRGELAGQRIDADERDPLRHLERNAGTAGQRRLHVLRPDGQRRLRAAEADGLIVVEPD